MSEPLAPRPAEWALPRGAIVLLGGAGAVILVAGMRAFSDIMGPVFLALMLTIAVTPIASLLLRKGWPGWLVSIITIAASFAILIGFALILAYAAVRLATLVPQYADETSQLTRQAEDFLDGLGVSQQQIDSALANFDVSDISGYLIKAAAGVLAVFSNFTFVCILLFFMGLDLLAFNHRLAISKRLRPDIGQAFESFVSGTRSYLLVSTVFGLIVAVIDVGALWLLGIPLPILWGFISFITNYIPNIGFLIGVIPPALLGLLEGGWLLMIAVIVIYSVINFVIQSLIQPRFVGESVGLATTVTFLSLTIWAWILGPLGALLAIPLTLLTKAVLIDMDPATRWMGLLLMTGRPNDDEAPASDAEAAADQDPEPAPA